MPEVAASLPTACALPLGREYGVYVSIQTGGTEGLVMSDDEDGNGTAVSHLYRFRSIKNLLDRDELENQEIFLAHPDAMNDPTEGIKDVFWQGDKIVWENLFKLTPAQEVIHAEIFLNFFKPRNVRNYVSTLSMVWTNQ
jgi:hypothetical protein